MLAILNRGQVDPALKRIALATQSLLRDTIDLDEEQWHAPSLLPGWSRAHVATHIARNADALRRVLSAPRPWPGIRGGRRRFPRFPESAPGFHGRPCGA